MLQHLNVPVAYTIHMSRNVELRMSSNKGSKRKMKDQLPCRSKVIKMAGVPGSCSSVRDASSISAKSSPVNSNNTTTSVRGDSVTSVVMNTTGDINLCPVCKQTTISTSVEINSLRCCLCDTNFHGDCLSIDETLMNFSYVVVDVGGGGVAPGVANPRRGTLVQQITVALHLLRFHGIILVLLSLRLN